MSTGPFGGLFYWLPVAAVPVGLVSHEIAKRSEKDRQ